MVNDYDTIAAISTPSGEGGIGIVRISGDEAIEMADKIYAMGNKKLSEQESHTIHYGHIVEPDTGETIDEVMVSILRAPKTYTREDVVEINTHGGMLAVQRVLQTVFNQGARMAEPGEFTKRAFLNGRIDLTQAEAVMDVIEAKSEASMNNAVKQLDGQLSERIETIRREILNVLAQVEVNVDYPEYEDIGVITENLLEEKASEFRKVLQGILETAKQGRILRDGLRTAIIGRPNVGKSSLLNALLRKDRAIVTDIAGTTRDIVEEYINIKGVPLRLIDTAGIRETEDVVERIGVERSRQAIEEAEFILLVFNQNEALSEEDKELIELTNGKDRVVILNKMDLESNINHSELYDLIGETPVITTAIIESQGLDSLEQHIADYFFSGETIDRDANYVSNTRHIALITEAERSLGDVLNGLALGMPVDLVQIDMTNAWESLGAVTGDTVQDELITQLFTNFCLGK